MRDAAMGARLAADNGFNPQVGTIPADVEGSSSSPIGRVVLG